jgi:hypothetical protein
MEFATAIFLPEKQKSQYFIFLYFSENQEYVLTVFLILAIMYISVNNTGKGKRWNGKMKGLRGWQGQ